MKTALMTAIAAMILLTGCSTETDDIDARDGVFGTQVRAHDSAKEVEDAVLENFKEKNKSLENQGG